jgi:hypothetical protein
MAVRCENAARRSSAVAVPQTPLRKRKRRNTKRLHSDNSCEDGTAFIHALRHSCHRRVDMQLFQAVSYQGARATQQISGDTKHYEFIDGLKANSIGVFELLASRLN